MSHRLAGVAELADARDSKARPTGHPAVTLCRIYPFPGQGSQRQLSFPLDPLQNHYMIPRASSCRRLRTVAARVPNASPKYPARHGCKMVLRRADPPFQEVVGHASSS